MAFNLVVRTEGDPRRFEQTVRQAFLSVDNTQPIYQVRPLEDYVAESQAARRFTLMLLGLFGGLAVVLAAVGIYGVISYAVSLRTRELGIRMALGAERGDMIGMVLREGLTLVALGTRAWIRWFAAAHAIPRFLLFQVRPADLTIALAVTLTLSAVALLANYLPARKASRVDPIRTRCATNRPVGMTAESRSQFHAGQALPGISEDEAATIVHSELGLGLSQRKIPNADLEIPHYGPTQGWPIQLCIGPTAILGDTRVASRRTTVAEQSLFSYSQGLMQALPTRRNCSYLSLPNPGSTSCSIVRFSCAPLALH